MRIAAVIILLLCMGCIAVLHSWYDYDYYYPDYTYRFYDYPYYSPYYSYYPDTDTTIHTITLITGHSADTMDTGSASGNSGA
jgi:hypothetical protein